MTETARLDDRFLPWKTVKDVTGLSRTTAWRLQKRGEFPLPVSISPGRVGWRESEIAAWSASRRPGRRPAAALQAARSFAPGPAPASLDPPRPEPGPAPELEATRARARRTSKRAHAPTQQMNFNF